MIFKGKIINIGNLNEGTTKNGAAWAARDITIEETVNEHPQKACFNYFKSGEYTTYVTDFEGFQLGQEIEVEFNIDASEWKGRWFTKLKAWKINKIASLPEVPKFKDPMNPPIQTAVGDDDLPF